MGLLCHIKKPFRDFLHLKKKKLLQIFMGHIYVDCKIHVSVAISNNVFCFNVSDCESFTRKTGMF